MTSAHPDSPHARSPPQPVGAARRASHMSSAPSSGRPDQVTRVVTSGQERKATVYPTVPTYVTKCVATETINRERPEATPTFIRPSRRPSLGMGSGSPPPQFRRGTAGYLQDEVVLKRSTHAPANQPEEATVTDGRLVTIRGRNTGEHFSSQ